MHQHSPSTVPARHDEPVSIVPCKGDDVLAALTDNAPSNRSVVVLRAPSLSSDGLYRFHSPSTLSEEGRLSLGFPLNQSFSAVPVETMQLQLAARLQRNCSDSYGAFIGTGRSGQPAIIVDRLTEHGGLSFREQVAEFDYRWRGFIEYRFSPESTLVDSAAALEREGNTALTILREFTNAFYQITGERGEAEKLHLSVER